MLYRILVMSALSAGLPLLGCAKPTMGDATASAPQEKASPSERTAKDAAAEKAANTKENKGPSKRTTSDKPADKEKVRTLKEYLEKHHYKWSDEQESDFPLVIEMQAPPVPEEIQGPFPVDAPWRTTEKTPGKKPENNRLRHGSHG
jgi:hypothetical protein